MLLSLLCFSVSADFTYDNGLYEYEIITANDVEFSSSGTTTATAFPRGSSTIDCLVDGDAAKSVTAHNEDGIVLVCNDYIKPKYEENMKDTTLSTFMVDQALEDIPNYSFVLDFGASVTFDAVYISLFHETNACVAIPGDNAVTVEYSKNGRDWTPVGTDGIHYYRTCDLPNYVMDAVEHNCAVEERIVPLAKEVSAKYVRLTFNFMTIPEDSVWRYYSNVYEWVGFTELAVASYKSGEKPELLSKESAAVADVAIEGEWIFEGEDIVYYYSFANDVEEGNVGYIYKEMLASEYEKDGINAEYEEWASGFYYVDGDKLILESSNGVNTLTVSLSEDKLTVKDGIDSFVFGVYTGAVTETSDDQSTDEGTESSKTESKPEDEDSSIAATSFAPVEEQSSSVSGVLVAIIIAAVVVVLAVVGVIIFVARKKNK